MTVTEAQQLMETAVRLVRVHAETLPMFDADGDPRHVTGLALDALLSAGSVPQVVATVHGAVSVGDVENLLRHIKAVMWDAVAAESR